MVTANEISVALVGVTFFLASATLWMAIKTSEMAEKTRDLVVQEERHHREGLMPICEFDTPADAIRPVVRYGEEPDSYVPSFFEIIIPGPNKWDRANIRNIGLGPALHLKLCVHLPATSNWPYPETYPTYVDDRAPNTSCLAPRIYVPNVSPDDLRARVKDPASYIVYLEYTDIFGTPYHTILQWAPGKAANLFQAGQRKEGP